MPLILDNIERRAETVLRVHAADRRLMSVSCCQRLFSGQAGDDCAATVAQT